MRQKDFRKILKKGQRTIFSILPQEDRITETFLLSSATKIGNRHLYGKDECARMVVGTERYQSFEGR
jgi:hypothetical protein